MNEIKNKTYTHYDKNQKIGNESTKNNRENIGYFGFGGSFYGLLGGLFGLSLLSGMNGAVGRVLSCGSIRASVRPASKKNSNINSNQTGSAAASQPESGENQGDSSQSGLGENSDNGFGANETDDPTLGSVNLDGSMPDSSDDIADGDDFVPTASDIDSGLNNITKRPEPIKNNVHPI